MLPFYHKKCSQEENPLRYNKNNFKKIKGNNSIRFSRSKSNLSTKLRRDFGNCDFVDFISKSRRKIDNKRLDRARNEIQGMLSSFMEDKIIKEKEKKSSKISHSGIPLCTDNVNYEKNTVHTSSRLLLSSDSEEDKQPSMSLIDKIYSESFGERRENKDDLLILNENTIPNIIQQPPFIKAQQQIINSRELHSFENVYDSFSEEEIDEDEVEIPKTIILPKCLFRQIWDSICAFLIFYSITVSPFFLAFNMEETDDESSSVIFYIEVIQDILFMVDIVLNFFTAYIDSDDDELIVSKSKIAMNYICGFFTLDVVSSIPLDLIMIIINSYDQSWNSSVMSKKYSTFKRIGRVARFYRLLKWARILRMLKLTDKNKTSNSKVFKRLRMYKSSLSRFLKFCMFFIILMHITSCIWIFIAHSQSDDMTTDNWIDKNNLTDRSYLDVYLCSLYFTLGTIFTIGYGDVTATSTVERVYLLIFMTVGCVTYSFVLSSLSTIFSHIDLKTSIFNKKQILLDQMKIEYHIPKKLYKKIRKALTHDFKKWNDDRIKLLDTLPGSLRNSIYLKMNENQIKHLKLFHNQSYDFILFVLPLLKSSKFLKNEIIISYGEILEEMYIIIKGIISLHLGSKYDNFDIGSVMPGDHFGDIIMYLNDQCNYDFKVRTKYSELFILTKLNFASIKLNFRNAVNEILKLSYNQFIKFEKRRNAAIQHYANTGSLSNFGIRDIDKDSDDAELSPLSDFINEDENGQAQAKGEERISISNIKSPERKKKIVTSMVFSKQTTANSKMTHEQALKNRISKTQIQRKYAEDNSNLLSLRCLSSKIDNANDNENDIIPSKSSDTHNILTSLVPRKRPPIFSPERKSSKFSLIGNCHIFSEFLSPQKLGSRTLRHQSSNFETHIGNKADFLENLNNRIESQAFLFQNKILVQDYIQDFLGMQGEQSHMKNLVSKLRKIEKSLVEFVGNNKNKIK